MISVNSSYYAHTGCFQCVNATGAHDAVAQKHNEDVEVVPCSCGVVGRVLFGRLVRRINGVS